MNKIPILPLIKQETLDNWLKKTVSNAPNKDDYYDSSLEPYLDSTKNYSKKVYNRYYNKDDDIDIRNSDKDMIEYVDDEYIDDCPTKENLKYYIENYGIVKIAIPPNTNHYHTSYLFKSLLDHVENYDMIYNNKELFNKNLKIKFYEFCRLYTK